MTEKLRFSVTDVNGEMRIRDYLKNRIGFSTSLIAKVKFDNVYLNGIAVHMRAQIKNGDIIEVILPTENSESISPIDIPIEVIYEDDHLIALNKPVNMPTHPSRGNHLPTLAECLRAYIGEDFVFRAISRLDRDTSGIVLVAKNQLSAAILSRSLKAGEFKKIYYAKVVGVPNESEGIIDLPIIRESEGNIKRVVRSDGKRAITKYKVLRSLADGNSILELEAVTGRTHQLRVHLSHVGHPLVADFLYGKRIEGQTYQLHCGKLEFPHPLEKRTVVITADPPFSALK